MVINLYQFGNFDFVLSLKAQNYFTTDKTNLFIFNLLYSKRPILDTVILKNHDRLTRIIYGSVSKCQDERELSFSLLPVVLLLTFSGFRRRIFMPREVRR